MKKNKMKTMLKMLMILVWIIFTNILTAQQTDVNFGEYSRPVPSISSLANYNNTPVSFSTGIPSISIPLLELPTKAQKISVPLALAYNSANVKKQEPGSNIGTGWSLLGGGVISREIIGSLNEVQYQAIGSNYSKYEFDDIYYYNLPGVSGKFKFNRNVVSGTIDIENLSANNIKISYVRDNSPQQPGFTVASFTIIDENGYKYIFSDYSESSDLVEGIYQYRSAFFLSQIKLADDSVVVAFEYRKDSKPAGESPTSPIAYTSCKLTKVSNGGSGSIVIDYQYDITKEKTMNDPYSISQVLLKDSWGNVISGYRFNYKWDKLFPSTITDDTEEKGRRLLNKLLKINKNLIEYEKMEFMYSPYQENGALINENYHPGLLNKMIFPTGGVKEYTYEAHDYFFNKSSQQYLDNALGRGEVEDPFVVEWGPETSVINVDTNQSSEYTLSVLGNPDVTQSIALKFIVNDFYPPGIWVPDPTPDPNDEPAPGAEPGAGGHYHFDLKYTLKKDGVIIDYKSADMNTFIYTLKPGNYTVSVSGTGGKAQLFMSQIRLKNGPYPNRKAVPEYGSRIKSIKQYNSINDTQPVKSEYYSYAPFNEPISSSGYIFRNESEDPGPFSNYLLYKNVSVTDGENGLVRYYFKTPDDYPKTAYTVDSLTTSFWNYYTITKSGVLTKKETYNKLNELLSSEEYDSEFETLQGFPDVKIHAYDGVPDIYTKPAYIKNTKIITKTYLGGIQAKSISEKTYNSNFNPNYIKEVSSDGIITEKRIRYAGDKNKIQLINANIVSVPLETETRVNDKVIEKVETLYADSGRFDPASVIVSSPDNGSITIPMKYDEYDSYGNLRQYSVNVNESTGIGFPTVIIWGYNQALPIAKIDGARLSDIGNLASDIITKSNADKDTQTESDLIGALDLFRNIPDLKKFMITTYTYDPLIGMTTETSPDGIRAIYKYDQNGRLKSLLDVNGNILKEFKYNNKLQP